VPQTPTDARHRITQNSKKRAEHDSAPEQNETSARVFTTLVLDVSTGSHRLGIRRKVSDRGPAQWCRERVRQACTAAAAEFLIR